MLGADMMVNAINAPLHHRKNALYAVRGDAIPNKLASLVVNALMLVCIAKSTLNRSFVGMET
jgi:hypothetical protein